MSDLMRAQVAAPKVGMKPRTLLDKAKKGQIRCVRDGRLVLFAQEFLDEYAAGHTVEVIAPTQLPPRNPRYTR